jgi:putative ABC transport system substrate-binding protein
VFTQISDPIGSGFVADFARPGGNMTGFINFEDAMGGKWLGVLKEAAPNMRRVAVLFGSDSPVNLAWLRVAKSVALSLGVEVTPIDTRGSAEIEQAIGAFASEPDGGLMVVPHPSTIGNRASIIISAARPGELPIQAPSKFSLVVNLKTATALGLNIPPAFPLRADELIE